jgi:hypothetical protein
LPRSLELGDSLVSSEKLSWKKKKKKKMKKTKKKKKK